MAHTRQSRLCLSGKRPYNAVRCSLFARKRFRGGLVFKAHRLWVSLNSRLECNKEEEDLVHGDHVRSPKRALPTETKVESGTSQSKGGISVNLSNSRDLVHGGHMRVRESERTPHPTRRDQQRRAGHVLLAFRV